MSEINARARKKQIIVGLVSGAVTGVIISALTQFWWWLPTGMILGLASGMLMKPPAQK
ncbi:HPP family protein [Leucobacter sp. UCMA 4100]|uniref:HPP family protein n=1 Tax=Leucobacter sp. UCMA 4100 TaxID=2810534 RepID=UPI0022EB58AD|nr:HPP family protein [Leucobacter sp. UCMA 4100]MDA3147507.1 HPP family protein [Leucobacter sp. UCMA 4100]